MIQRLTREELKKKLDRADAFVLVDTLPAPAYRKHQLPHAINIPSDDIVETAPRTIPERAGSVQIGNAPAAAPLLHMTMGMAPVK